MSKPSSKKNEKKKQRAKEVKVKIMARREAYRNMVKENHKFDKEERITSQKILPIRNEDVRRARIIAEAEIKNNLQANMELLETLQDEYAKENPGKSLLDATEEALEKNEVVKKFVGKFQEADTKHKGRIYPFETPDKNN